MQTDLKIVLVEYEQNKLTQKNLESETADLLKKQLEIQIRRGGLTGDQIEDHLAAEEAHLADFVIQGKIAPDTFDKQMSILKRSLEENHRDELILAALDRHLSFLKKERAQKTSFGDRLYKQICRLLMIAEFETIKNLVSNHIINAWVFARGTGDTVYWEKFLLKDVYPIQPTPEEANRLEGELINRLIDEYQSQQPLNSDKV